MTTPTPADAGSWVSRLSKPILFTTLVIAAVGVYLAFRIPVAVFPDTNFPRIVVGIDNGVMPIDQMEVIITRPIEEAMNSIPGLQSVRSITSRGSAEIDLFFDWNEDMVQTLQLVDSALSHVQASLPPTVKITTNRLTFASFPILGYSLTSDTASPTQLWELANYDIKPRLSHLNGVATVVVQGGLVPEYRISPDPAKLLATGVTVPDLLEAVRRTNLIDSPGLFQEGHELVLGLISGQVRSPQELAQVVVKNTPAGVPVRIGDLGEVAPSTMPVYTIVHANGKPGVLLNIRRQPTGNTVDVANQVAAEVAAIRRTLPSGVRMEPFYDQSGIVNASIHSVRDAILVGILLASAVLVLFLRDWGSSVVAGLVIPITIAVTMVALYMLGETFNLMTLGGLAAAVGLVIDDAIVVVENIVLHRDTGQGRVEAVRSALREITVPLIGSTVTPIVVFLPLVVITGVTGTFFRALAITMSVALFTSLLLALTWTPTLSQYFVRRKETGTTVEPAANREEELRRLLAAEDATMSGFFGRVVAHYERALKWSLEHTRLVGLGCLVLVVLSYFCYRALGTDLLPAMDEGGFVLDYFAPAGASLAETDRMVSHVERMLHDIPDVESTSRRTGMELGLAAVTEAHRGDLTVRLRAGAKSGTDEVIADMREQIAREEPGLKVEFVQILSDMIDDLSNAPEPVRVNLFSANPEELAAQAPRVADAISKVPGVTDVLNGIENTISGPSVLYQVNPSVASRAGFTTEEVALDAAAMLEGEPAATPMVIGERPYTVRVRYRNAENMTTEQMNNTLLNSTTGHTATLGSMATISAAAGETEIRRENLQRLVSVSAQLEGTDLGTAISGVQQAIAKLNLPADIRVQYGGRYQEQQQSFRDLTKVLVLALLLIFAVLLFEFRSFSAPVAIVVSALLSTSGVLLALLITRVSFNIASFMGLIMVVGIVAKNGILLLDAEEKFRELGLDPREAIVQAGRRRLRPIAMTALAAVAGMLPLALAIGAGAQMLQPLAIAVIGGVVVSMALSLLVTPTIHGVLTQHGQTPGQPVSLDDEAKR